MTEQPFRPQHGRELWPDADDVAEHSDDRRIAVALSGQHCVAFNVDRDTLGDHLSETRQDNTPISPKRYTKPQQPRTLGYPSGPEWIPPVVRVESIGFVILKPGAIR